MTKAFVTHPGFGDTDEVKEEISDAEEDDSVDEKSVSNALDETLTPFEHHSCFSHSLQLVIKDGFFWSKSNKSLVNTNLSKDTQTGLFHTRLFHAIMFLSFFE